MDKATKKFIEEQNEKLAIMVAKGFEQTATKDEVHELREDIDDIKKNMATKEDIVRLEDKIEFGLTKQLQETDELRDRMRVLETRVDHMKTASW